MWQKFDCEVARPKAQQLGAPGASAGAVPQQGAAGGSSFGGSARIQLDPEYRKLSRERQAAAATKTRTVQYLADTKLVGAPTTVQASAPGPAVVGRASSAAGRGYAAALRPSAMCRELLLGALPACLTHLTADWSEAQGGDGEAGAHGCAGTHRHTVWVR